MSRLKKYRIFIVVIFILAILAFWAAGSVWASYNLLTVNTYNYETEKAAEDMKFLILSDLHSHQFGEENEKLVEKVREQNPDLILLDGDMLNGDSPDAENFCSLIRVLKETAPVYVSPGNHEYEFMESHPNLVAELEAAGANVLEKEYVDLEINGTALRLGGMYEYAFALNGANDAAALDGEVRDFLEKFQDTDRLKIMMSHRPDSFIFGDASRYWDVDLVVSGHNHGGQVVLPFMGGLYGGDQGWFPEFVHGIKRKNNMTFFVTSGLGSDRQVLPRFYNRPEIAVLSVAKPLAFE